MNLQFENFCYVAKTFVLIVAQFEVIPFVHRPCSMPKSALKHVLVNLLGFMLPIFHSHNIDYELEISMR